MDKVLIGIVVIAILLCFFNSESFITCLPGASEEAGIDNSNSIICTKLDTVDTDYYNFQGKTVNCKNGKKGAKISTTACPKGPDGTSGKCAVNSPRTGNVLMCR